MGLDVLADDVEEGVDFELLAELEVEQDVGARDMVGEAVDAGDDLLEDGERVREFEGVLLFLGFEELFEVLGLLAQVGFVEQEGFRRGGGVRGRGVLDLDVGFGARFEELLELLGSFGLC